MYNLTTLKTELAGWVGFRESSDAAVDVIDSTLKASGSGTYFDEIHPVLQTDVLYSISPDFMANNYAAWSGATTYATGARVVSGGKAWQSKLPNNLNHTPAAGVWWELMFSVWLRERLNASISNLFNRLATEKKLNESTKSIFDNKQIFVGSGKLSNTITPRGRFVGLAIRPKKINNIRIDINAIGLHFTDVQTDLPVYLFNSSSEAYIAKQLVSTIDTSTFAWVSMTGWSVYFNSIALDFDPGSEWYVGYFEDDIAGNAIQKSYDFLLGPCISCPSHRSERNRFNMWNKYFDVMPVTSGTLDGENLPADMGVSSQCNFGLNMSVSVRPDVTEIFTMNKQALTYPLQLQFAVDMLTWAVMNPARRTNPTHGNIQRELISYDLDGSGQGRNLGLRGKLTDAIKALDFDFSRISAALPDSKPSRFNYRAI
jgi:hypothetical protein